MCSNRDKGRVQPGNEKHASDRGDRAYGAEQCMSGLQAQRYVWSAMRSWVPRAFLLVTTIKYKEPENNAVPVSINGGPKRNALGDRCAWPAPTARIAAGPASAQNQLTAASRWQTPSTHALSMLGSTRPFRPCAPNAPSAIAAAPDSPAAFNTQEAEGILALSSDCLLYTSPSPRD